MKQKLIVIMLALLFLLAGCAAPAVDTLPVETITDNPLLDPSDLPFGILPLDKIETEHFLSAFEESIRQRNSEIKAIINNPEPPTFENTIEALDYSFIQLQSVASVFYNFLAQITNDELDEAAEIIEPMISEHLDDITLNSELFSRIEAVYMLKDELELNEEEMMLLKETYRSFAENGAALSEEDKERFKEINMQLSSLTLQFSQNIMGEVEDFRLIIDNAEDLSGLPASVIASAAETASSEGYEGAWAFTLQGPSIMPFLTYADNRGLREQAATAYIMRGRNNNEYNNEDILKEIITLRLESAKLLGHEDYASYSTQGTMAGDRHTVEAFLDELWEATLPVALAEAEVLQQKIYSDGHNFELAFWDWRYYAEKVREESYALNSGEISSYLELNNVLEGLFMVVENLWDLRIEQIEGLPLHHPEATTWEVTEADGSHVGIIYMDLFPRPGKQGGASMNYFREQYITPDGTFVHPIITVNCNFTRPPEGEPTLLSYDEMVILYHEFGHALHGLLSRVTYQSFSGTSVPRDFVELPSQLMENWARSPEVLKMFARHYESGKVIPNDLIDKIKAAAHFNQGFLTLELMASALLDFGYHTLTDTADLDVGTFEHNIKELYNMPEPIYFRHGSTHFVHIISWGYAAGYYSYLWSGVLDADVFEAFVETGDLFDQTSAQNFRQEILEKGGSRDAMEMFVAFRGREPEIEPLLKQRGLQ